MGKAKHGGDLKTNDSFVNYVRPTCAGAPDVGYLLVDPHVRAFKNSQRLESYMHF